MHWRPTTQSAEDRNLDLFILSLQAIADLAADHPVGRGSQHGRHPAFAGVARAWRPTTQSAEDRNRFNVVTQATAGGVWRPTTQSAEDRNTIACNRLRAGTFWRPRIATTAPTPGP